jgi:putative glycosyltransferase (TIGR04372 family)
MSAWSRTVRDFYRSSRVQNRMQDLAFRIRYVRRKGFAWIVGRLCSRGAGLLAWLVLLPVTLVLHVAGFRHVPVFTERIGHLALEPDCLLKEQALGRLPRRRWILLSPRGQTANEHLLAYWRRDFRVIRNEAACFLIRNMSGGGLMRQDVSHYVRALGKTQFAYRVYTDWGERAPLLRLSDEDKSWGEDLLERMGMPRGAWFACVHAREAGYSPVDEEIHSYRNGRIENTFPAMREIVRRGGWVVRLGDPTMRPLPHMPQVIDYALHPLKSDRLDVFLCAQARFTLGNTSGIAFLSSAFGVPCALANMIPVATMGFGPRDISIPKRLWSEGRGRYLTMEEILASDVANYQYARQYAAAGLRPDENSAEDIQALAIEMLDALDPGRRDGGVRDPRAERIRALFNDEHFAYGASSRISRSFLRNHPEL